ncbi:MAG: indolepyruvate oxidoreductase subunit beta [Desulfovibrio sp.]|nr:indolepyruvate oxidoreductase subunit beta [Desulfovibrio sp.]
MIASQHTRMRIFFTGVGGQGTLTATTLLARTALDAGLDVVAGEVHGMAQRGGVVESVMLVGGWRAPKLDLGEADVLLGFEPLETLRALPWLRPGGTVFSNSDALPPLSVSLGAASYPDMPHIEAKTREVAATCYFLPCRALGLQAGSVQSGNTVLLSAVCASGVLPFGVDALEQAIKNHLPAKLQEVNLRALELGKQALAA